ncbi:unnamed protein product [Gongylonema pulchrum]|uniref:Nipped-B protein n=1 Tax=Gongylonema pulchrum TaxID=637853 RepID=A0A3P7LZR6_9BILA|nr:unnamed protein product [Gongylonema pulchrum]
MAVVDATVNDSLMESKKLADMFLMGFLTSPLICASAAPCCDFFMVEFNVGVIRFLIFIFGRLHRYRRYVSIASPAVCTAKAEEDYRRLFDHFLHDLLAAWYEPEWPAADMLVSLLSAHLMTITYSKNYDMSLRIASLDYLGIITAALRKHMQTTVSDDVRLSMVVKTLAYEELDESEQNGDINNVDISSYAVMFYAAVWYKSLCDELKQKKLDLKKVQNEPGVSEKEKRRAEKKFSLTQWHYSVGQRCIVAGEIFGSQFADEIQLSQIIRGIHGEPAVGLRTKAMRCLTMIIETDHSVLKIHEVRQAVQARMLDPNAAVREATIELIGKYLIAKPDYVPQYYPILIQRIMDSGVAVRKRVIRIMREICEQIPSYEKVPEILVAVIGRISDEEGVRKLAVETLQILLFQPVRERDCAQLVNKVLTVTNVMQICGEKIRYFEQFLNLLYKNNDRAVLVASRQIVDTLVDNVLSLDSIMASGSKAATKGSNTCKEDGVTSREAVEKQTEHHKQLLACMDTLLLFSKTKPELLVINILERVVPVMDHPSETFLSGVDQSLYKLVNDGTVSVVCPSISSLLIIGFVSRYFDLPNVMDRNDMKQFTTVNASQLLTSAAHADHGEFVELIFQILFKFCQNRDGGVRSKALDAIGQFTARYTQYLTREEVRRMYINLLRTDLESYRRLKKAALRNLELFLNVQETKMVKDNTEWQSTKDEHDLKEMELANSGLASAIIQVYWSTILNSYYTDCSDVRMDVVRVVTLTLKQGLVTPGSSIPTLIAMSTDPEPRIRSSVERALRDIDSKYSGMVMQGLVTPGSSIPTLIAMSTDPEPRIRSSVERALRDIDSKYSGMVMSKAITGIRQAFRLRKILKIDANNIVRGIRSLELLPTPSTSGSVESSKAKVFHRVPEKTANGQAMLSGLYQNLRGVRQQRRSFLSSVLRLFSEDSREKLTLEEWVYVADNLAMFPYQVIDEPLYVIRQIESIVSVSGQNIINTFMANLLPRSSNSEVADDDDVDFDAQLIYREFTNLSAKFKIFVKKI